MLALEYTISLFIFIRYGKVLFSQVDTARLLLMGWIGNYSLPISCHALNVYNGFITLIQTTFNKGQVMQQHLLIDGDDTLWENNIYFERAIEAFIDFLDHSSLKPEEVRAVLDEIEMTQGYGSENFTRSLQATYRQ